MIKVIDHWCVGVVEYAEIINDFERMTIKRGPKGTISAYDFEGNEISKSQKELKDIFDKIEREFR